MGRRSGKKGNKSGKKNNNVKNENKAAIVPQEKENLNLDNEVAVVEKPKRMSAQERKTIAKRKREELALIEERLASAADTVVDVEENVSDNLNSVDALNEVKNDVVLVEFSSKDEIDDFNSVDTSNEAKNDQVLVEFSSKDEIDDLNSVDTSIESKNDQGLVEFSNKDEIDDLNSVETSNEAKNDQVLVELDHNSGDICIDLNIDKIENENEISSEEKDDEKVNEELSEEKNIEIESSRSYTNQFLLSLRDKYRDSKTLGNFPESIFIDKPADCGRAKPFNFQPTFGKSSIKIESRETKPVMKFSLSVRADAALKTCENAWRPSRVATTGELSEEEEITKTLYKNFRAMLNKLTPEKFEILVSKMMKMEIGTCGRLRGIIDMIFEKSVSEPGFSSVYAQLCRVMFKITVPSDNETGGSQPQPIGFNKLLVGRCQREFEKNKEDDECRNTRLKEIQSCTDVVEKEVLQEQYNEYTTNMRKKSVGTIRFIGELYKQRMMTNGIMLGCLNTLIVARDEESLECLCKLLNTVGQILDQTIKQGLSKVVKEMEQIASSKTSKVSSRIRFMLLDTIDLRLNGWIPRIQNSAPKTLIEINKNVQTEHLPRMSLPAQMPSKSKKPQKETNNGWTTVQNPNKIKVEFGRLKRTETLPAINNLGITKPFQKWGNGSESTRRQSTSNTNIFDSSNRRDSHIGNNYRSDSTRHKQVDNIRGSKSSGQYRSCANLNSSNMYSDKNRKDFHKQSESSHHRRSNVSFAEPSDRHRSGTSDLKKAASTRSIGDAVSNQRQILPNSLSKAVSTMSIVDIISNEKSSPPLRKSVSTVSIATPIAEPEVITPAMVEKYETAFKNTIEEFCSGNCKIEECDQEIRDIPGSLLPQMLEDTLLANLERSRKSRIGSGEVFASLVKNNMVTNKDLVARLRCVFSYWEDFIIDIPTLWEYLGEVLAPLVHQEVILLNELSTLLDESAKTKFSPKLLTTICNEISNASGNLQRLSLEALWKKSNMKLEYFVPELESESFVEKNKSWLQNCLQ